MFKGRAYWQPEKLLAAAEMLQQAERNISTRYPHDAVRPAPDRIPAALALIEQAQACIKAAQPVNATSGKGASDGC